MVYPHVGNLLGLVGGAIGFIQVYLLPIMVYQKRLRLRITHPRAVAILESRAREDSIYSYKKSRGSNILFSALKGILRVFYFNPESKEELQEPLYSPAPDLTIGDDRSTRRILFHDELTGITDDERSK